MDHIRYKISELAEKADVTRRTIHYYLSRGLLPPSEGEGINTTYSEEHLFRILLIKRYQESYLPLDEIKKILNGMILEEIKMELEKAYEPKVLFTEELREESQAYDIGVSYKKILLGHGVEIHYLDGNRKSEEVAKSLYKYGENILKER